MVVYRGTRIVDELRLLEETDGYVFSEAARDGYHECVFDGDSFTVACQRGLHRSQRVLQEALMTWGNVADYSEAHSEFSTELAKAFGPRPAISWTTDLATAKWFAGDDGYVLEARIPVRGSLGAERPNNAEDEVLIANGVWVTRLVAGPGRGQR